MAVPPGFVVLVLVLVLVLVSVSVVAGSRPRRGSAEA